MVNITTGRGPISTRKFSEFFGGKVGPQMDADGGLIAVVDEPQVPRHAEGKRDIPSRALYSVPEVDFYREHLTDRQSAHTALERFLEPFLCSWDSNGQDGSGYGIYAQRFNAVK